MPINFPLNPLVNQTYTNLDRTWQWNGRFWQAISTTIGYSGSIGATGPEGATGPSGPNGYTGSSATWFEFATDSTSPKPLELPSNSLAGFNAYNSKDFPGSYYAGISVVGNTVGTQLAIGWDVDNASNSAPVNFYVRANDDTGDTQNWSPWNRVILENELSNRLLNYLKLDPDGDGISVVFSDQNPNINGVACGGGWYFGADGNINSGLVDAKFFNARNGHVNSSGGYYVGTMNPLEANNAGKYSTTQIISSTGLIMPTAGDGNDHGIKFPNDPAGGLGDTAWIRYYAYDLEKTNLEIGVSNDAAGAGQDSINFVTPSGVGVNKRDPSEALHVTGNILASGTVNSASDARLKTNVTTIENSLDLIANLRGVTYESISNHQQGMGVLAQELESVIPCLVNTDREGFKSVSYGNFAGLFIECIKELKDQIQKLQTEIEQLKGNI